MSDVSQELERFLREGHPITLEQARQYMGTLYELHAETGVPDGDFDGGEIDLEVAVKLAEADGNTEAAAMFRRCRRAEE